MDRHLRSQRTGWPFRAVYWVLVVVISYVVALLNAGALSLNSYRLDRVLSARPAVTPNVAVQINLALLGVVATLTVALAVSRTPSEDAQENAAEEQWWWAAFFGCLVSSLFGAVAGVLALWGWLTEEPSKRTGAGALSAVVAIMIGMLAYELTAANQRRQRRRRLMQDSEALKVERLALLKIHFNDRAYRRRRALRGIAAWCAVPAVVTDGLLVAFAVQHGRNPARLVAGIAVVDTILIAAVLAVVGCAHQIVSRRLRPDTDLSAVLLLGVPMAILSLPIVATFSLTAFSTGHWAPVIVTLFILGAMATTMVAILLSSRRPAQSKPSRRRYVYELAAISVLDHLDRMETAAPPLTRGRL